MNNDLISRNDLVKFKILPFDKASCDDTEINAAYQNGWNDAIDRIINNAPTVEINTNDIEYKAYCKGLEDGKKIARPQGECCGICYLCDVDDCKADSQKGGAE